MKTLQTVKQEIRENIANSTSNDRIKLAKEIVENKISVSGLIEILLDEHPVSMRFSWLLGDIIVQSPKIAKEALTACYKIKDDIRIKNFDRSLSKMILHCENDLPINYEGEIINDLFTWLNSDKITVSTKNNCVFALENLCEKYLDLKGEVMEAIEIELDRNTKDFVRRAEKVLSRLKVELRLYYLIVEKTFKSQY